MEIFTVNIYATMLKWLSDINSPLVVIHKDKDITIATTMRTIPIGAILTPLILAFFMP